MKFSIAVLSSILAVCSVTVANPVDPSESTDDEDGISTFIPSATTSTEDNTFTGIPTVFKGVEYNFWIDANPDGIGLGALDDPIPVRDWSSYRKKWETDKKIVRLIFGTPLDVVTVIYKSSLIKETPSVKDYLEQQSLKYESIDQKSGGRRKRKDLESSDEESSDEEPDEESEYKFNRKGTFSMRRASSKFITRFGSFFQQSKRDDPSN
ncbi:hypothetical protein BATDEDRAFT_25675 [Batrachochytrium dendrobatidis JAM81]|uniref:Uncharacterized protein n=1 Tax=Batrachochytrium dendrobatidis (strain JAM81 / FGSC 10211) TaxID=684364 RepID=F4P589_BATDJ|nr:uncharacterized protein BATDEDRAFT_25675 [Batrachochytrium dendrobatidis JAM81]EGF79153.1 hypothetical protein BATDEDRAFT_25675 [Batrachochytrium dendrobatidis JAM81]|eukprot:XP_006679847.1 hypothetical protein BATDEDRAFT_25675 [Batrachochytrium dendrobatidis JAM81]